MSGCMNGAGSQGDWEYGGKKNWLKHQNIILLQLCRALKGLRGSPSVQAVPSRSQRFAKMFEVGVKGKVGLWFFSL